MSDDIHEFIGRVGAIPDGTTGCLSLFIPDTGYGARARCLPRTHAWRRRALRPDIILGAVSCLANREGKVRAKVEAARLRRIAKLDFE